MSEVNFGSTFRIPITQQGVNKTKKVKLKGLVDSYGGLVGTGNTGYARVSIENDKDAAFIRKLKDIGYKVYQQFEGEKIARKDLDEHIRCCLANADYKQYGKQKNRVVKQKYREPYMDYSETKGVVTNLSQTEKSSGNNFVQKQNSKTQIKQATQNDYEFKNREAHKVEEQNAIRNSESYKKIAEEYGQEAAEAMFFYSRK